MTTSGGDITRMLARAAETRLALGVADSGLGFGLDSSTIPAFTFMQLDYPRFYFFVIIPF